jgi:hypothetical protein
MSQSSPGYSTPLIKQKRSYKHGPKSEQVPRYPLTFMCGYPLRYYLRTHRSYIWCYQEPTRSAGTRQGIHDATSEPMCCGKWSALRTSYVIPQRIPAHERKWISRNLCTFGPMLIGTFLLN